MKKQVITTKQGTFTVSATLKEQAVKFPNDKNGKTLHNRYLVTVCTDKGRASFAFYDSHANLGRLELDDLRGAFECFVSDAISGGYSFDEFCGEFGYNTDSRSAERIHRACEQSAEKLARIFAGDIYELNDELND